MEEGLGPRAVVDGLRGRQPAREVLRQTGRLRLHCLDGGGPRRHCPGCGGVGAVAQQLLLRTGRRPIRRRHRGFRRTQADGVRAARRHRRKGGQLHPSRPVRSLRRAGTARRTLRPLRAAGRRAGLGARGHRARRANRGAGRVTPRSRILRPRPRHPPVLRAPRSGQGRSIRAVRAGRLSRGGGRQARHRVAAQDHGPRQPHA